MKHLAKDIPYRNTTISYVQTKNDIDEMLKEAGVIALRWTDTQDSIKGTELPILEFIMTTEWNGVEKSFSVQIQTPLLYDKKRDTYHRIINTPNRNASMRLLYWYLKSRLEGIKFGLDDVFNAFMSRITNELPDGRTITLGEQIKQYPNTIKETLPNFVIKPALENKGGEEERK